MDFVPAILEELGCSRTPWKNPDLDTIQACVNEVYPGLEYIVEKGDTLELSVSRTPLPLPFFVHMLTLHNRQTPE